MSEHDRITGRHRKGVHTLASSVPWVAKGQEARESPFSGTCKHVALSCYQGQALTPLTCLGPPLIGRKALTTTGSYREAGNAPLSEPRQRSVPPTHSTLNSNSACPK